MANVGSVASPLNPATGLYQTLALLSISNEYAGVNILHMLMLSPLRS
jgi:hypothetical protein